MTCKLFLYPNGISALYLYFHGILYFDFVIQELIKLPHSTKSLVSVAFIFFVFTVIYPIMISFTKERASQRHRRNLICIPLMTPNGKHAYIYTWMDGKSSASID